MCATWQVLKLLNALLLIHIYGVFFITCGLFIQKRWLFVAVVKANLVWGVAVAFLFILHEGALCNFCPLCRILINIVVGDKENRNSCNMAC